MIQCITDPTCHRFIISPIRARMSLIRLSVCQCISDSNDAQKLNTFTQPGSCAPRSLPAMVVDAQAFWPALHPLGNAARVLLGARRATPLALSMTPFQKPGSRPIPPRSREVVPLRGHRFLPISRCSRCGHSMPYLTSPWLAGQVRSGRHRSGCSVHWITQSPG
jgi:hypothetical protein